MSLLMVFAVAGALAQSPAPVAGGSVSGRVVEEGSRAPVSAAQVVLVPIRSGPAVMPFRERPQTVVTDQDGRYTFLDVPAGRYMVSAQKGGYAMEMGGGAPNVELQPGERRDGVEVPLQKGGVIVGRVLDESGEPQVNIQVMAMRKPPASHATEVLHGDILIPAGSPAATNDLGEFRLFSLAPGEYYVQAMPRPHLDGTPAPRAMTLLPSYFPSTSDPSAAHPIVVAGGQTSSDVVVRMVSAAAFQISGVVVDDSGRPVANVLIRLDVSDSAVRPPFMMGMWTQGRTDASGKFTLNNVTAGTYTLVAIPATVVSGPRKGRDGVGSGVAGGVMSWGAMGGANGPATGAVFTEMNQDGTTLQYRDDTATRVPIAIENANVTGLELMVRPPP